MQQKNGADDTGTNRYTFAKLKQWSTAYFVGRANAMKLQATSKHKSLRSVNSGYMWLAFSHKTAVNYNIDFNAIDKK